MLTEKQKDQLTQTFRVRMNAILERISTEDEVRFQGAMAINNIIVRILTGDVNDMRQGDILAALRLLESI